MSPSTTTTCVSVCVSADAAEDVYLRYVAATSKQLCMKKSSFVCLMLFLALLCGGQLLAISIYYVLKLRPITSPQFKWKKLLNSHSFNRNKLKL